MKTPQRILFLAEGQLGDQLILTPALRAVKESFPGSRTTVLVVERYVSSGLKSVYELPASAEQHKESLFSDNRHVDEILIINRQMMRSLKGWSRLKAELTLVSFLRKQRYDTVICTFPQDRFVWWAFASGASVRVGQRRQGLRWMLNVTPDIEKEQNGVLEYYCDLIRAIGAEVRSAATEYTVPDAAVRQVKEYFRMNNIDMSRPIVAVHPGATGDYKIWPPASYAALIDNLSEKKITVLLVSGVLDEPVVASIRSLSAGQFVEIRTQSRHELAAVLQHVDLCISNDSGPRHIAVALGIPSLAFFRKYHDKAWGIYKETGSCKTLKANAQCPVCPEGICLEKVPEGERFGSYCLREISVETAVREAELMLAAKR